MQRRSSTRQPAAAAHRAAPPAVAGHRPLVLAVALAAGFAPLAARTQPSGAQAIVGAASLSQQGNRLVVTTQNGAGGFSSINWQSFSVPAGTSTWFAQPSATSTSINRVVGADPSAIFGTLGSNGRLVLVNPAGITVGAGAVVDTAGFTASTLRMSDADALAGRMRFDGSAGGVLQVDGQVLARSGDVVLIGSTVQTGASALVQSPEGATVLAAGQKVEVTGRGLEGIVFEVQAPADQAVNLGTLKGDAVGVFAGTLRHSGVVQAQAVSIEGGRVVLKAADQALVAGTVQAQGIGGAGGSVDVLGARVGLLAGASIDTSNTDGGGRIRVGGDYQGSNAQVPNAQVTYVDATAQLKANATGQGNGGKVIVWADDTTRMHGSIEANAGAGGGDGGFVETSGKRFLDAGGARVAATAPRGRAGTWLLDPDDLTIMASPGPTPAPTPAPSENYAGNPDFTSASAGSASVIYDSTLNAALNGGNGTNVTVTTGASSATFGGQRGDIILLGNVDLHLDQPGSATLTLNAYNDIRFSGGTTTFRTAPAPTPAPASAPALSVVLNPGMGSAAPGSVVIEAGAGLQATAGDPTGSVAVTVRDGRTIANDGSLRLDTGTSLASSNVVVTGTGTIDIAGTVRGASVDMAGDALTLSGATVTATAGSLRLTSNGPADIYGSSLSATGGDFRVSGGSMFSSPERSGLSVSDSTFSTSGTLLLDGGTSDQWSAGLAINGTVQLNAAGGSTLQGSNFNTASYGDGVSIATNLLSGSGPLSIVGRASGFGSAVNIGYGTVSWTGDISMRSAAGGAGDGIYLYSSLIASGGGAITLGTDRSIQASYSTLDSGGGNITIGGGSDALSGIGVSLTGSSVHAYAGKATITGKSANDIGFLFQTSQPALTVAGSDVLITGSSLGGGTAIRVDGETITSTNSMRLNAVGGGIEIVNGSALTNTGPGPMVLDATPGAGTGYLGIYADATSVLSTGSLRATGDDVLLQNVDFGSKGGVLSGSAANGGFTVQNVGTGPLQVGSVDGAAGITASGTVLLATPGQLRLSEAVQSNAGPTPSPTPSPSNPNAAITVVANDLVTDGNGQLLAPNDRWAVWLTALTPGLAGSPVSGNDALWGRTFGTDALTETGNRYLFQYRPTASVAATSITRTYDGTANFALSATAPGLVDASQYGNVFNQDLLAATLSVTSPAKDVGTYAITVDSYALPAGYLDGGFSNATATITPATLTVAGLSADKVYDGTTAATFTGTAALSGVFAGDSVSLGGTPLSGSFADKNVGAGKLVRISGPGLSGSDGKNYVLDPTITASITPKALFVGGLAASDKVYDATTSAQLGGTATLSGVLGNDSVAMSGTAAGAFADKNVGTSKLVTVGGLGLSGIDAGNYQIVSPSLTASITPATLKIGGLAAADKVYDGTTSATLAGTAGVVGLLGADSVALTGTPTATFADKDVGSGKAVSVGLAGTALAGTDAGNYVLAPPTGLAASITPAPLVITATDQNKLQGSGFTFAGTEFRATGLVGGESIAAVSLASTGSASDAAFGLYPIAAAGPVVGGNGFKSSNYLVSYLPGTMVVSGFSTPVAQQVQSEVVTFLKLYTQETLMQSAPAFDENGKPKGSPDVVNTEPGVCRPV